LNNKLLLVIDKVVGFYVGGGNSFEMLVKKIIFYESSGSCFGILFEESISSLVGKILFLHRDLDFKVISKRFSYTKKSIDLDQYGDAKGYKIYIKVSKKVERTSLRYIDFIIEKNGTVLFDERIRARQRGSLIESRSKCRLSSGCITEIVDLFDTIGVDSSDYTSIRVLSKVS